MIEDSREGLRKFSATISNDSTGYSEIPLDDGENIIITRIIASNPNSSSTNAIVRILDAKINGGNPQNPHNGMAIDATVVEPGGIQRIEDISDEVRRGLAGYFGSYGSDADLDTVTVVIHGYYITP